MSNRIDELKQDVREAIGQIGKLTYAEQYPEIKKRNVFSISTLARGADAQIAQKNKVQTTDEKINMFFLTGKAIHELLQRYYSKKYLRLSVEFPLNYYFPFNWQHYTLDGITVIGHVDVINWDKREIYEFKTSTFIQKSYAREEYNLQALTYKNILERRFNREFRVFIIWVSPFLQVKELFDGKESFETIKERAYECARRLDSI